MRRNVVVLASLLWILVGALVATDVHAEAATAAAVQDQHERADDHGVAASETSGDEHATTGHGDEAAADDHGDGHGDVAHGEHLELPHFVMMLRNFGPLAHNETFIHYSHIYENVFYALLAGGLLCFLAARIYRRRSDLPDRLQAFAEILVEQVLVITCTMMGEKDGRKYAPLIASVFVYLLVMNYSGLVPLGKAPTSTLINNASIAIVVFLFVQYTGLRRNGLKGYLHHLAGSPKDAVGWGISPLMFFLEVVGEFIKPMSLSLRLFGNIFGEDTLLAVFAVLGIVVMAFIGVPVGLPLHLPFLFLSLLLGLIQALVFSLLTTVYISLMLPHGDHDGHGEEVHA